MKVLQRVELHYSVCNRNKFCAVNIGPVGKWISCSQVLALSNGSENKEVVAKAKIDVFFFNMRQQNSINEWIELLP